MRRRDFGKASLGALSISLYPDSASHATRPEFAEFPKIPGLTKYVGTFILTTKYEDIPADVIELGKKSILDGFGLALAGSRADSGPISRKFVEQSGVCLGKATIMG